MPTANIPWLLIFGNLPIAVENQDALKNLGYWSEMECSLNLNLNFAHFVPMLPCISMVSSIFRSRQRRYSVKKGVLKNFANFTEKHLCHSLFFNKFAGFQAWNFIKKWLQHKCFPVNFAKFFRTPFLQNIWERFLLSGFQYLAIIATYNGKRWIEIKGEICTKWVKRFSKY